MNPSVLESIRVRLQASCHAGRVIRVELVSWRDCVERAESHSRSGRATKPLHRGDGNTCEKRSRRAWDAEDVLFGGWERPRGAWI
jgi:hypothetical protein